jgi:hypothetical protein
MSIGGGVVLGLIETAYVFAARRPPIADGALGLLLCLVMLSVLTSAGALIGLAEGLIFWLVSLLTKQVATQRLAEPRLMASIFTVLTVPLVAALNARILVELAPSDPPGGRYAAWGVGLLVVALVYLFVRAVILARDRFRMQRWGKLRATLVIGLLVVAAAATYAVEYALGLRTRSSALLLVLSLAAAGACQIAVVTYYAAWRRTSGWIGRILTMRIAVVSILITVTAGTWGLWVVGRSRPLHRLARDNTSAMARIIAVAERAGIVEPERLPSARRLLQGRAVANQIRTVGSPAKIRPSQSRRAAAVPQVRLDRGG